MRRVNLAAIDLIKHFESLHDGDLSAIGLQPKECPAGIWTIGYGHALRGTNGKFLKGAAGRAEAYRRYPALSIEDAERLLDADLAERSPQVEKLVRVQLTDNQFGAVMSLAFNIGLDNFSGSTLLRKLNAGDYVGAANQFTMWRKSDGVVMAGLVRRRAAERVLFLS